MCKQGRGLRADKPLAHNSSRIHYEVLITFVLDKTIRGGSNEHAAAVAVVVVVVV